MDRLGVLSELVRVAPHPIEHLGVWRANLHTQLLKTAPPLFASTCMKVKLLLQEQRLKIRLRISQWLGSNDGAQRCIKGVLRGEASCSAQVKCGRRLSLVATL